MKRLLTPLILAVSLVTGSGIAAAAIKASTSTGRTLLSTSSGNVMLSSAAGVGFATKGGKAGAQAAPVDVRFAVEPQSEGLNWVTDFLAGKPPTLDASLQLLDQNYKVQQSFRLGASSLVEVELPGADAVNSKQALEFRIRLQPSQLKLESAGGDAAPTKSSKTAKLLGSNFRVSVDGVADPYVAAVSPVVVRRGGREISGLAVTLPLSQGLTGQWWKWAQEGGKEQTLRVEYLDASLKTVLLTVDFKGVTVASMQVDELDSSAEQSARVSYRLNASGVSLK
jgi:hypothetical protein